MSKFLINWNKISWFRPLCNLWSGLGGSNEARLFGSLHDAFFLDAYFFFFCRCASFLSLFFYARWCDIRGRSKTTLTNFSAFFDHLTPFVDSFYLIKVDIFWTTYPPFLVNVVCERQIELILSGVFWFLPLHALLKKQQGDNCTHALNRSFLNEQFCPNSSFFQWGILRLKTNPFGNSVLIEVKNLFGRLKSLVSF